MPLKKPANAWTTDPAVARALNRLSKAALIDCVVDLLREHQPSVDDAVRESLARDRLEPVLSHRGDPWPTRGQK